MMWGGGRGGGAEGVADLFCSSWFNFKENPAEYV